MKLYAIVIDEYPKYHIVALTADREKAKKIKEMLNYDVTKSYNLVEIEECEDNEITDTRIMVKNTPLK